jgi:SNF2 family DNA or RNA helicase
MAHGLTLTRANTIIWASPTNSLELYLQANARITRSGQGQNTFIVHIAATRAEQQVYNRLRRKETLQGALLDLFEAGELTTGVFGAALAA